MNDELCELLKSIRSLMPIIREKYLVASLEVFGSYVKNQHDRNSDLDLLVTFLEMPSLLKFVELKNFLSDELHLNIDLVMRDSLKPNIRRNIVEEAFPV